ncbi:DUF1707 SHOCT-like domain-containing protein [Streptomyces boninensis]|uniref:DUF1707 SHOCT-like domain-containing protein n=1 Tax=Streptomyces boninensis TaxID=2039455 RepID=UPI003B216188
MDDTAKPSLEKQPATDLQKQEPRPPAVGAELRASDKDRDRVAEILREALAEGRLDADEHSERIDRVYAAKTHGELEPIVRDLPAAGERPVTGPAPAAYTGAPHSAAPAEADNLVAIFSGASRKGRWRVGRRINAFALFGGVDIDLTEAYFEHPEIVIKAVAVFGGVEVRVPENVTLRSTGSGIFGGFDVRSNESPEPGAPVVVISGFACFGGVDAKPKRGKLIKDLKDHLRKHLGH